MEIKTLYLAGHPYQVLETTDDGEMKLFLLQEVNLEALLCMQPESLAGPVFFGYVH